VEAVVVVAVGFAMTLHTASKDVDIGSALQQLREFCRREISMLALWVIAYGTCLMKHVD
jgi:hypothetical protein